MRGRGWAQTLMGHSNPAVSPPVALKLPEVLENIVIVGVFGYNILLIKVMLFLKNSQTKIGQKGRFFERLASQSPACPTLIFPAGAQAGSGPRGGPGRDRSGAGSDPARLDRALPAFVESATKRAVFLSISLLLLLLLCLLFLSALELRVFIATPPKSLR